MKWQAAGVTLGIVEGDTFTMTVNVVRDTGPSKLGAS
jgi:hypothetical protein